MCLRNCFCYCCGPSWASTVSIIATIDLLTSIITVTFEIATVGTLSGILVPLTQQNDTNCVENCTTINYSEGKTWLDAYINDDITFNVDTYTVTGLILLVLIGFIVEGYLYSTLVRGVHEKIHKECRKWFNYRLTILIFVTLGSVAKFLRGVYYPPIDGLLDILKVYRVITLLIVRCFMTELAHTVGIIYVKPPKKPKRGSL